MEGPEFGSAVFGGLNDEETAEVMGISESTAKREWKTAKAWLAREMQS